MAVGLAGRWWERAAVLATFYFVINGVGNAIETIIFTTLDGQLAMAAIQLPQSVLGAVAVALLFAAPSARGLGESTATFFAGWKPGKLAFRLGLAILAFPILYLTFGMMVAPIVTPIYDQLDFLITPPMPTILKVLVLRSALLLLASLPVIVCWQLSRGGLILALSTGHFVAVGLAGLIQAPFFPAVLRWTHGIEILADSICYAAILVWLFVPRVDAVAEDEPVLRERLA